MTVVTTLPTVCHRRSSFRPVGFIALLLLTGLAASHAHRANADEFPQPYNSERDESTDPLPADQAAAAFELPPGFQAQVFAAEPDVQNPIAMAWDDRGRMWIAENYTYAERTLRFDMGLRDRVLILEDRNGDGQADERTVFTDNVQMLTGLEVGRGGVWLMCPPKLLFIPDGDRNDVPDGPAEVVLDGFDVPQDNYHNFANGLKWGPDGWLYGRCGGSCPGRIGRPGTPDDQRFALEGGMWRYHPVLRQVETLVTGTTNPWGHDWNENYETFFVNTVNGHLWHMIPGAHFVRPFTLDPNPRAYELIDLHADHWHFDTGGSWTQSRDGAANEFGGGHAHSGCMIYLGTNWPAEYRDRLLTLNLHGRRANQEILERSGSGYMAEHADDVFLSGDAWFRGMDLSYGPDGGVFVLDWSDTGECHENTGVHRTSGRVFKIIHGDSDKMHTDIPAGGLRTLSDDELVELQSSSNEWLVRQSRLLLTERSSKPDSAGNVVPVLRELAASSPTQAVRLRTMLTAYAAGGADRAFLRSHLKDQDEHVRGWAIRLLTDLWPLDDPYGPVAQSREVASRVAAEADELLPELIDLAKHDPAASVRLVLASTLQRLPVDRRAELAAPLAAHAEDRDDHNLPLMVWYGLAPVADSAPKDLLNVFQQSTWPKLRQFIARRLAEDIDERPEPLNDLLAAATATGDTAVMTDVLNGLTDGVRGFRKADPPAAWEAFTSKMTDTTDESAQARLRDLSVLFGDGRAMEEVKRIALDGEADPQSRLAAVRTLVDSRPDDLLELCTTLLADPRVNVTAAEGLAVSGEPAAGDLLVKFYRRFRSPERSRIIALLVSRPAFAKSLLTAVEQGSIAATDLTPFDVRQIHSMNDSELSARVSQVWGEMRATPEDRQKAIDELRHKLTVDDVVVDQSRGRFLFQQSCAKCHRLYGVGESIGPDLTGSNRGNLDYLLENILDPSAVVGKDFRMTIVMLTDGRVLNGLVVSQNDRTMTLQTQTDRLVIDKNDIEATRLTTQSPMPDGLLKTLSPEDVRNLFAYLQSAGQVPLPDGEKP